MFNATFNNICGSKFIGGGNRSTQRKPLMTSDLIFGV